MDKFSNLIVKELENLIPGIHFRRTQTILMVWGSDLFKNVVYHIQSYEVVEHGGMREYGDLLEHGRYYPDVLKMKMANGDVRYLSVRLKNHLLESDEDVEFVAQLSEKPQEQLWKLVESLQKPLGELKGFSLYIGDDELRLVKDDFPILAVLGEKGVGFVEKIFPTLEELDEALRNGSYRRTYSPCEMRKYRDLFEHGGYYPDVLKMKMANGDVRYLSVRLKDTLLESDEDVEFVAQLSEKPQEELWKFVESLQKSREALKSFSSGSSGDKLMLVKDNFPILTILGEKGVKFVEEIFPTLEELDEALRNGSYRRTYCPRKMRKYGDLLEHGEYFPDVLKMNTANGVRYLSVRVKNHLLDSDEVVELVVQLSEKPQEELREFVESLQKPLGELKGFSLDIGDDELRLVKDDFPILAVLGEKGVGFVEKIFPTLEELYEALRNGSYQRTYCPFHRYLTHTYLSPRRDGNGTELKFYHEENDQQIVVDYVKLLNNEPAYGLKGKFFSKAEIYAETSSSYKVKAYINNKLVYQTNWVERRFTDDTKAVEPPINLRLNLPIKNRFMIR